MFSNVEEFFASDFAKGRPWDWKKSAIKTYVDGVESVYSAIASPELSEQEVLDCFDKNVFLTPVGDYRWWVLVSYRDGRPREVACSRIFAGL